MRLHAGWRTSQAADCTDGEQLEQPRFLILILILIASFCQFHAAFMDVSAALIELS
jgi:hypothetical protein